MIWATATPPARAPIVPEMTPVVALIDSPLGRPVALNVAVVPLAVVAVTESEIASPVVSCWVATRSPERKTTLLSRMVTPLVSLPPSVALVGADSSTVKSRSAPSATWSMIGTAMNASVCPRANVSVPSNRSPGVP